MLKLEKNAKLLYSQFCFYGYICFSLYKAGGHFNVHKLCSITEFIIRVVDRMIELNRPKRLNFERFQEEFFNIEHGKSIELHPPDSNWGGFRGCYDYDLGYKLKFSLGICYVKTL